MAEQRKKLRLGELLVQQGLITQDQLRIALTEQKAQNIPIGRLLVRLGFVTEAVIRDIMARTIGQESTDLSQVLVDAEAVKVDLIGDGDNKVLDISVALPESNAAA